MSYRICKTCNVEKPLDADHFYRSKGRFCHECKECAKTRVRERRANNRDEINAQNRERRANDPEYRERENARNRTPERRERNNALRREHRANDPEYRERENARLRTPEYRERKNARLRELRATNPEYREKENAHRRERLNNNPELREAKNAREREKRANNPEYRNRINARQRTQEVKERKNARRRDRWANEPEYKNRIKASRQTPEFKKGKNDRRKERRANEPGYKERENARLRTPKRREWQRARNIERQLNDPEYMERRRQWDKEWRNKNPEKALARSRASNNRFHYRIEKEEREYMHKKQEGRCAICLREEKHLPGKYLQIDHNHKTGEVRSLLCANCNTGIGRFAEDIKTMKNAIAYLNRPGMAPSDIPFLTDQSRYNIPYWEAQSRDKKFRRRKNENLKYKFGIDIDQYEWLLAEGNGVCWICHCPEEHERSKRARYPEALAVDHDHSDRDIIRGLLCNNCNTAIGSFEDSAERLKAAIAYLEQWNDSTSNAEDSW